MAELQPYSLALEPSSQNSLDPYLSSIDWDLEEDWRAESDGGIYFFSTSNDEDWFCEYIGLDEFRANNMLREDKTHYPNDSTSGDGPVATETTSDNSPVGAETAGDNSPVGGKPPATTIQWVRKRPATTFQWVRKRPAARIH